MADATVTSLDVKDGVLHITGTGFTQTTTTVYVDDATVTHAFVSSTELTVDPAPVEGAEIVVEKGGVQTEAMTVPSAGSGVAQLPAEPVVPAASGPVDYMTEQEKDPNPGPLTPPVEPGPPVETNVVAAKQPYPTGSPQDPEDAFQAAHGFRRAPPEEAA